MIKVTVRGIEEVRRKLETIVRGAKKRTEGWVGEYLIGDRTRGLRHYDPYRYVGSKGDGEFKTIYGGFFSKAQQGYVMAAIADGRITPGVPHREDEVPGWELKEMTNYWSIRNDSPGAKWAQGDTTQTLRHERAGWRTVSDNIRANLKGAFRHAQAELKKWLKARR